MNSEQKPLTRNRPQGIACVSLMLMGISLKFDAGELRPRFAQPA